MGLNTVSSGAKIHVHRQTTSFMLKNNVMRATMLVYLRNIIPGFDESKKYILLSACYKFNKLKGVADTLTSYNLLPAYITNALNNKHDRAVMNRWWNDGCNVEFEILRMPSDVSENDEIEIEFTILEV